MNDFPLYVHKDEVRAVQITSVVEDYQNRTFRLKFYSNDEEKHIDIGFDAWSRIVENSHVPKDYKVVGGYYVVRDCNDAYFISKETFEKIYKKADY